MKKKLMVKIATIMCVAAQVATDRSKLPNSLFLWGEPTAPLERPEN